MEGHTNHFLVDIIVISVATASGVVSVTMQDVDIISGIILKWVSILASLSFFVINWKKIKELFKK